MEKLLSNACPTYTFNMINSGVGGNSDREKMSRYAHDVLDHAPDILLVQFGGNNSGYMTPERFVPVQETEFLVKRWLVRIANVPAIASG